MEFPNYDVTCSMVHFIYLAPVDGSQDNSKSEEDIVIAHSPSYAKHTLTDALDHLSNIFMSV